MTYGIYQIEIENKLYIGKDHHIDKEKRKREHLRKLKNGSHYNKKMQENYNLNHDFKYSELEIFNIISDKKLCEREEYWINKHESYANGYNLTMGGLGHKGLKYTDEQLHKKSENITGDKNPMSKISLDQFLQIVDLLNKQKSNKEISEMFNLHQRYVSLIRNKKRYKKWFEIYAPEYIIVSGKQFQATSKKVDDKKLLDIQNTILNTQETNVSIGKKYDLDPSTISRIRTKLKRGA